MKIIEIILAIVFWTVAVVVLAVVVFGICYYAYRSLEGRDEPFLESDHLSPMPETGGFKLEPCLEHDPERIVIQELIESKQLCEEALGIYQQIEKVREQLEGKR